MEVWEWRNVARRKGYAGVSGKCDIYIAGRVGGVTVEGEGRHKGVGGRVMGLARGEVVVVIKGGRV